MLLGTGIIKIEHGLVIPGLHVGWGQSQSLTLSKCCIVCSCKPNSTVHCGEDTTVTQNSSYL